MSLKRDGEAARQKLSGSRQAAWLSEFSTQASGRCQPGGVFKRDYLSSSLLQRRMLSKWNLFSSQ